MRARRWRALEWLRAAATSRVALLAGAIPVVLLCIGVVRFTLNHFYVRAPWLHDAGWLSAIVYRAGVSLPNPEIACDWADTFYGVHVSPVLSLTSLASYLAPLGRIEWFALVQALVFLPLGCAVQMTARALEPRAIAMTVVASLAFAFTGLMIVFICSQHYEPAIAGIVCLLLVALLTGRVRLAWFWLGAAVLVREDAGLHTALALVPLWFLRWRGREMSPRLSVLTRMIAVAIAASVTAIVIKKLALETVDMTAHVYTGDPPYAHLSIALIVDRVEVLLANAQHIYYPLLATVALAAVRRDPGYVLGWVVTIPWTLLNLLARDPEKAILSGYIGFPFAIALFWTFVYGGFLAPRRLRPNVLAAVFAAICASSTCGLYQTHAPLARATAKDMFFHRTRHAESIRAFTGVLTRKHEQLGRLFVDPSVAALALESLRYKNSWRPGVGPADAIAFHRDTWLRSQLAPEILLQPLEVCTRIGRSDVVICTREAPAPELFDGIQVVSVPNVFAFSSRDRADAYADARGIVIAHRATFSGAFGQLPRGTYSLDLALAPERTEPTFDGRTDIARLRVKSGTTVLGTGSSRSAELTATFETDGQRTVTFRISSLVDDTFVITSARLRKL